MSIPDPVHLAIPNLVHDSTLRDRAASTFHQNSMTQFRHYMDLAETEYVRPMALLLCESFATNPVTTVFLTVFSLLIAVPVTVCVSASFFSIVIVLLGVVSTGIILIVAIQSILFISLSLSVLSSVALSAVIAALYYATSWSIIAITPPLQYTRDISLGTGAEGVAAAQSLATTVSERAPDWRDAVIDQTSMLREHITKVPVRKWGFQLSQIWHAIPWRRMYSVILSSVNATSTIIHTGFSIAQLVTLTIGLSFKVMHAMVFCVRLLVAILKQAFTAMRTLPPQNTDIPLQIVREDVRDGSEVGVSTGVSSMVGTAQPISRNKGKDEIHETQPDPTRSGESAQHD